MIILKAFVFMLQSKKTTIDTKTLIMPFISTINNSESMLAVAAFPKRIEAMQAAASITHRNAKSP